MKVYVTINIYFSQILGVYDALEKPQKILEALGYRQIEGMYIYKEVPLNEAIIKQDYIIIEEMTIK